MTREEAKEYVKAQPPSFLRRARTNVNGYPSYICPKCGSGSGKKGTGIAVDMKALRKGLNRYQCFVCNLNEDIIGLWQIEKGITDSKAAFESLYEYYGLAVDDLRIDAGLQFHLADNAKNTKPAADPGVYIDDFEEGTVVDFTEIVEEAHVNLMKNEKALSYLFKRGLTIDIIKDYKLGYDAQGHNHFLQNYPEIQSKSRKVGLYNYVLPYKGSEGKYTYFLTEITDRTQIDEYNGKYRKLNSNTGIKAELFNERYIKQNEKVVFICEGIYDALSVEVAGGKAIAFVGTAHRRFLSLCKKYNPATVFVLALDNDAAGNGANKEVQKGLDSLGMRYIVRTAANKKDFNEDLQTDKGAFMEYIKNTIEEAEKVVIEQQDPEVKSEDNVLENEVDKLKKEYLETSTAHFLEAFINGIADSVNTPYTPTGFKKVDQVLDGGLYEGLYIIGAISSLGKTTLITQITDQIAAAGNDILIFSLEMARSEIMAKSISRETLLDVIRNNGDIRHAKTTRGITTGARWAKYCKEEVQLIERAIATYGEYAGNIYIHEGIGNIGVEQIREAVKTHIAITGKKPVVVIDYLQILAPADIRASDKQNTDKAVMELKRISRDYKITVLGISSFNRENYKEAVTMKAFKESGAIEYSSDVLIGLQLKGAGGSGYDENAAKAKNPREIELVILKNRNGSTGHKIPMEYYPLFNYFKEQ